MTLLADLLPSLARADAFATVTAMLARGEDATLAVSGLVRPLLTAAAFATRPRPTLVVVSGADAADRYARNVATFLPGERVLTLPVRRTMPWDTEHGDLLGAGRRARALDALVHGREVVVVTSAAALLRCVPPSGSHVYDPLVLDVGGSLDLATAAARLVRMGYERVERAEDRGQFAIRGGLLDVFGADAPYPVRAELFGDDLEALHRYVPSTGQSIGTVGRLELYPAREVALGSRASDNVKRRFARVAQSDLDIARELELIDQGIAFNGVEAWLPSLYNAVGAATDYLCASTLVEVVEPRSLVDDATREWERISAFALAADRETEGLFIPPASLDLGTRQQLTMLSLMRTGGAVDGELAARHPEVAGGEAKFVGGVRALVGRGYGVLVTARERRVLHRLSDTLVAAGVSVTVDDGIPASGASPEAGETGPAPGAADSGPAPGLAPGVATLALADVPAGFVIPDAAVAVVSVEDVYPRAGSARRRQAAEAATVSFAFKPGDYVVHATHGIALLRDVVRRDIGGVERDYLLLEYAKGDKLYVPVDQLDRVTKYVGPDASAPRVTRLNTTDWSRATGKARKAARKLAFDLVDLYARRSAAAGFAFGPDTPWQAEMEAMFPFEETPDQLSAIEEVKADMESDEPMDRLVCGDVGYGKTEIAIRSAFKAAQAGKQVMILCPTTILAQQHFVTFSERYSPFGVVVDVLSRFKSKGEQAEVLERFAKGGVDVLVGTHRLLSADVTPRDLGLIVVDEEQRFGVEAKEHLKNLREQVDVLTLTATPIPRTLQMSLSGVRDMSIIDTPPPNRFPVKVRVGEYDGDVVAGAIRGELARGGQVYYIHNRVQTIDEAVRRVTEAVPEARVAFAHGKMTEHQLERAMESFSAGDVDVLVSTTIVESGIDNPHTNTLVIEDSERLGLAQLYQLKGRVGRSHVRAFAYFLFSRGKTLTPEAMQRLEAIGELTEQGAGIKVAMRDLEIRGAGSLLGAEQHGQMSAVGFELYAEMLREAVADARGEAVVAHPEVRVDLPVPAFLPEEYVPAVDQRVQLYRRLAAAATTESVARIAKEMISAHGAPAPAAANLLTAARIRAKAATAGARNVTIVRNRVQISPLRLAPAQSGKLAPLGAIYSERDERLIVPIPFGTGPAEAAEQVLDAILDAVVHSKAGDPV